MHTNISEANIAVNKNRNGEGILLGFEFAIMREDLSSQNKKMRLDSDLVSEDVTTVGARNQEVTTAVILEHAPGDVTTHHVASLPLSRCMDRPPVHVFRHELESFVWSFFFILGCFWRGRRILNPEVEQRYTGRWDSVEAAKGRFLDREGVRASHAAQFAKSLCVEPQPLITCSHLLAAMLKNPQQLDAARMLCTLQDARDAYA
jgi:hypothetical protein